MDLLDNRSVRRFLLREKPTTVIAAGALVGGIAANMASPVSFLVDNLEMQANLILHSARSGVEKIVFLGSSCIYPRACVQPMSEKHLMSGPLEPTNESYAIAKLAGIQLCRAVKQEFGVKFVVPIPSNIYGRADHFEPERAHVLSALVAKFCDAREEGRKFVEVWGSGMARRELTHADDLADAVLFMLQHSDCPELINVGTGIDHSIKQIAHLVAERVGFEGEIVFDATKPEGMLRKVLDVSLLREMGWAATIPLEEGVTDLVEEYRWRRR